MEQAERQERKRPRYRKVSGSQSDLGEHQQQKQKSFEAKLKVEID